MSLHRNNVVTLSRRYNDVIIDLIHKSHNAQVPHPTMHHFVTEMCTCVHFSVAKWCIVGHLSNALWDLWDGSIALCVRWDQTTLPLRPRLHYSKHTVHWLHCSGCWFHLGSAYLHIISLQPGTTVYQLIVSSIDILTFEMHLGKKRLVTFILCSIGKPVYYCHRAATD